MPMTPEELRAWRKMVKLSQRQAAIVLGYGKRNYIKMESGKVEIRDCVMLACAAYALGIRTYDGRAINEIRKV